MKNSKERSKEWRAKNPEKSSAISARYRLNVKSDPVRYQRRLEITRKAQKKWRDNNKDKIRQQRKSSPRPLSIKKIMMAKLIERDGATCAKCGSDQNLTIQHIVPKCIGGTYSIDNLEILCLNCNINDYHRLVKEALLMYFADRNKK